MNVLDKKSAGKSVAVAVALLLIPVLYLLGMGPAFRLAAEDIIEMRTFAAIYRPVLFIGERSDTAKAVIGWYTDLWVESL